MEKTASFLFGMVTMGFVLAGLFFFRFWARTNDRLFALFGIAFWLMAANQAVSHLMGVPEEQLFWAYILRIIAFLLLIAGIVAKNLEQRRPEGA
jgi:hypothetical protein